MKAELWYKPHSDPAYACHNVIDSRPILSKPPDSSAKSGYHLVLTGTDLPKPKERSQSLPAFPKTLQEIDSLLSSTSTPQLGKAVGQWLVSGSVKISQSQTLLSRLEQLVLVSDKLRQDLLHILDPTRDLEDEEEAD